MSTAYTVAEAAEELRCSKSAVYAMVEAGRLRCYRIGRRGVRIPAEALEEIKAGER